MLVLALQFSRAAWNRPVESGVPGALAAIAGAASAAAGDKFERASRYEGVLPQNGTVTSGDPGSGGACIVQQAEGEGSDGIRMAN